MRVIELMARSRTCGSHGVVGYFSDMEQLIRVKRAFSEQWELSERELRLNTVFCCEANEALLQSCIPGEMHGINVPSDKDTGSIVARDPVLANKVRRLLSAGIL